MKVQAGDWRARIPLELWKGDFFFCIKVMEKYFCLNRELANEKGDDIDNKAKSCLC